ncbi:MAG TPA: GNAT family N-acetyltransferase [Arthrobacter sp.]|nr:GNAT family N-acetyltransferase [Arthrobacter sp.]
MPSTIRRLRDDDRPWLREALQSAWGAVDVARKGEIIDASQLPGFVAADSSARAGVVNTANRGGEYEIVSLISFQSRNGVGTALIQRCIEDAASAGCSRVWVRTTNNNIAAIALYQRAGLDLCKLDRGAVERSRRLKPWIPLRDEKGIRLVHELEFELLLDRAVTL